MMTIIKNSISIVLLLTIAHAVATATVITVPQPGHLVWEKGPPNLINGLDSGGSFASAGTDQRLLAIKTGSYCLEMDIREARMTRFHVTAERENQKRTAYAEGSGTAGRFAWEVNGGGLWIKGAQKVDYDPEFFPVRIVETGPWFQHFTLHDLKWEGAVPDDFTGEFWLEVQAWPDRVRIQLKTLNRKFAEAFVKHAKWNGISGADFQKLACRTAVLKQSIEGQTVYTFTTLEWQPQERTSGGSVTSVDPALAVEHNDIEDIDHLILDQLVYDRDASTRLGTPVRFGQSRDYRIRLKNALSQAARLDLTVQLPKNTTIVGHSLMLLDANGHQTGIPIQISKNWHRKELDQLLPYMGSWSHGRISLVLPAGFDETCTLRLIQGDFGAYNASSISQLSLVGWGGNGIWIQAALGSWGETICLQPGRVLRRTMVTDWRPFKIYSMGEAQKEYGWTANAGGADIFVYFDASGEYVPFIENRHLIESYGPCLARMQFSEISKDRKIAVHGTWYLPQTNDFARTYLKVRCEVLEDLEYSRFSLLQLGADRYNANLSSAGAVGNSTALIEKIEFQNGGNESGYFTQAIPLEGTRPWITLFGDEVNPFSRLGQAQRVAVLHDWSAVLGGVAVDSPKAAFYKHTFQRRVNVAADLVPETGEGTLMKGDYIDMTLELTLLPLVKSAYYGKSGFVSSALDKTSNDWTTAMNVSALSQPMLTMESGILLEGPLPRVQAQQLSEAFTLTGGFAIVPLMVERLKQKGILVATNPVNRTLTELNQEWRINRDGTWNAVILLDPGILQGSFKIALRP